MFALYQFASLVLFGFGLSNVVFGSVLDFHRASQQNTFTVEATYSAQDGFQHDSLLEKYTIKTAGRSATPPWDFWQSGIYDIKGRKLMTFRQGYNVITLENGQFTAKTFNLFTGNTNGMSDYLRRLPQGKTVIIATMDEAKEGRLVNGVDELIYDIGGSRKLFAGDMKYRSVYILMGKKGLGEGKGKEYYRGAVNNDQNSWLSVDFFISSNKLLSETDVGHAILQTVKFLGNNVKSHPSPKDVYDMSPTKPMEVKVFEELRRRKVENLKATFLF